MEVAGGSVTVPSSLCSVALPQSEVTWYLNIATSSMRLSLWLSSYLYESVGSALLREGPEDAGRMVKDRA